MSEGSGKITDGRTFLFQSMSVSRQLKRNDMGRRKDVEEGIQAVVQMVSSQVSCGGCQQKRIRAA